MAFGKIKNNTVAKSIASEGPMSSVYAGALEMKESYKYDKPPILRPSGFPTCSILTLCRIAEFEKKGYIEEEGNLFATFFTSVGTTVHEGVQEWVGKSGKILAEWQCVNPDCSRAQCKKCSSECSNEDHIIKTYQVGNICKKCGSAMRYHELEVEYDIITGHVDLILKTGKNAFWAGDFKTSSVKKLSSIKAPPVNYIYQISSYAWILKNIYDIPIKGYSIFYITRDNPNVYKEFPYDFDEAAEQKAKKLIDSEIKKQKAALLSHKTKDVYHAIDAKPCKTRAQYDKLMSDYKACPFVDICFGSSAKLAKAIETRLNDLTK